MIEYPWNPDLGNGRFRNPIICADYSDPDVIRVGDDYYMTASSFTVTPGLPILHSRDLVNWTLINHAIRNVPHPRFAQFQPGCGVWAPAIRYHAGKYWIFFPMPDEGFYVVTADDPRAAWSQPRLLIEGKGLIDCCPFWDDDGKAYVAHAYANSRAGISNKLRVRPMSPDGMTILGEGELICDSPTVHLGIEGPKVYKRSGYYYVFAPAGGVPTGWQTVLRSRHIYGPYEDRVVMDQGRTPVNGPHQGALVDTPAGDEWFIHFQSASPYGRVVHLQPVTWRNDWPIIGNPCAEGIGEPVYEHAKPKCRVAVTAAIPQTSDEFDSPTLGLQWQFQANHDPSWYSLAARPGHLRMFERPAAEGDPHRTPAMLCQKFPARSFQVETLVEVPAAAGDIRAGLLVAGAHSTSLSIEVENGVRWVVHRFGHGVYQRDKIEPTSVRLRLTVWDGGLCGFGYVKPDGTVRTFCARLIAQEGSWVGVKAGIFCLTREPNLPLGRGYTDFDYFRFLPPPAAGLPAGTRES